MSKLTTWAKNHKAAAILTGAGTLIVGLFVIVLAIGIFITAEGIDVDTDEPVAESTQTQKAEAKPAKTKAEPKPAEQKTEPAPAKKSEPKKTTADKPKPAPKKTEAPKPAPKKADKAKAIQKDLSVFFDCTWERDNDHGRDGMNIDMCPEEDVLLGTGSDLALKLWAKRVGEDVPTAYKVVGDGYVVITGTQGQANQAWDMLGADGEVIPVK